MSGVRNSNPQAKSRFRRFANDNKEAKNWIALAPQHLDEMLKTEADVPYRPKNNMSLIKKSITESEDLERLIAALEDAKELAIAESIRFCHQEVECIKEAVKEGWEELREKLPEGKEDVEYAILIYQEIQGIKNQK